MGAPRFKQIATAGQFVDKFGPSREYHICSQY